MRADLSPDDREGFMHFADEQTQWTRLSHTDEGEPCTTASEVLLTLGTLALGLAPLVAFILFMVF